MQKINALHITIATVFANLLNRELIVNSQAEKLVIEALMRSNNHLKNASLSDLSDYLNSMNEVQLKGLANNVKGIYHELTFVENINSTNDGVSAKVFEDTNHAGSDVLIYNSNNGQTIREVQLKATDDVSYLEEHFQKYPDIELMSTTEISEKFENIVSTGISNQALNEHISQQFSQISELDTVSQTIEAVEISGLLSGVLRASKVLSGESNSKDAFQDALKDIGIATGTTLLVSILFGT